MYRDMTFLFGAFPFLQYFITMYCLSYSSSRLFTTALIHFATISSIYFILFMIYIMRHILLILCIKLASQQESIQYDWPPFLSSFISIINTFATDNANTSPRPCISGHIIATDLAAISLIAFIMSFYHEGRYRRVSPCRLMKPPGRNVDNADIAALVIKQLFDDYLRATLSQNFSFFSFQPMDNISRKHITLTAVPATFLDFFDDDVAFATIGFNATMLRHDAPMATMAYFPARCRFSAFESAAIAHHGRHSICATLDYAMAHSPRLSKSAYSCKADAISRRWCCRAMLSPFRLTV